MDKQQILDQFEIEGKRLELELKRVSFVIKKRNLISPRLRWVYFSPQQATLIAALMAFVGSFVATAYQGQSAIKQKEQELKADLITKAVETGDSSLSRRNLKFLLDAGLIDDPAGKIGSIVRDSAYLLPRLQGANKEQGKVVTAGIRCEAMTKRGIQCKRTALADSKYCWQHDS